MATEKTANDYREERKARLAKASKQNSKKSHKVNGPKMSGKAKAIITTVVCVVIAGAVAYLACNSLGVFDRMKKIKTKDGLSYSAVEYEYYYKAVQNYYLQMSSQYDSSYGEGYGYYYTGYDTTKLPEDQEYPYEDYQLEDGSKATWKQFFEHSALYSIQKYTVLADMADKAGFKVSEEATAKAEEQLQSLRDSIKSQAEENNSQVVSLGKYLRSAYGKGMSESVFQKIIDRETLASEYSDKYAEDTANGFSLKELEDVYKKDPSAYNCVDFRLFTVSAETGDVAEDATEAEKKTAQDKAAALAKKNANEMFGKITDEASFAKLAEQYATKTQKESNDYSKNETTLSKYVDKASVSSSFAEDIIKWLYSTDTKANQKKLFDEDGTYYIFYMIKPSYRDNDTMPVDVRHILYQFDSEATDAEADAKKQKAYADETLKKIQKSDAPLQTFIEICGTDSQDTGTKDDGGLIQYVGRGKYVKEFEEWSLDPARKEGDCAVIETSYGYHVMYFVKAYTKPYWQISIANTLADEKLQEVVDTAVATDKYAVAEKNATVAALNDKIYKELLATTYADLVPTSESATA